MYTSLVTGGAGFIGAHVVNELITAGHKVIVVDDLSGGFEDHIHKDAVFIRGSVYDDQFIARIFSENKFDYVFHLAAYAAEGLSHFIKRFNYTNNLLGSVNLINASVNHEVRCFTFTSSIAVYGTNQLPMREDLTPLPEDSYGIAKAAVELELKASHEMFGLDYVVFRPHNVYGERQNLGDKYRNVIGIFMNRLMQGESLPIFGDGEQRRAFTYIKDIAPAIAVSPLEPAARNQLFNIGSDQHYSVNELALEVIAAMDIAGRLEHREARNEVKLAFSDHSKFQRVFPHAPSTTLSQGLRHRARWAKASGIRQSREFDGIEIHKNLPPAWTAVVADEPVRAGAAG